MAYSWAWHIRCLSNNTSLPAVIPTVNSVRRRPAALSGSCRHEQTYESCGFTRVVQYGHRSCLIAFGARGERDVLLQLQERQVARYPDGFFSDIGNARTSAFVGVWRRRQEQLRRA